MSHPAFHQAQREGTVQWGSATDSGTGLGCYFSPFGLAAWFMGDPFPLHQLLHCIGVDYWSHWVALVSPRVFLFHCLFPPETSGKEKNNNTSVVSLHLLLPLDRNWLCREHAACPIALLGKDTDASKFLLQASGTGPWHTAQEQHCRSLHTWAKGCQQHMGRCLSPGQ